MLGYPLAGTDWRLVKFQPMDDAIGTVRPDEPSRYTMHMDRSIATHAPHIHSYLLKDDRLYLAASAPGSQTSLPGSTIHS
jgi:hypothetical protein